MTLHPYSLAEGERRKLDALGLLAMYRESAIRRIQRDFLTLLLEQGEGTSDAVSNSMPLSIRKNCVGAAVNHLTRLRLIAFVRFTISTRPERHACPVRIWRLLDRHKAQLWLATHPELRDADDDSLSPGSQRVLFDNQETATPTGDAAGAAY